MTALSQKEQSCIVLEIASCDILVGFWFFSAIDVIMWCEGQCLSTLPFIYCTQQGWWTRRSVATSLTSVPGSPAELVRNSAIFSCRALVPECLCLCLTHSTFSGPQTLSCAGRSTCWFFLKLLTWCRGGGFSLPSPQHSLHLSPGLLCKTWSPSWEVEKGHYTCKNIPAW